MNKAGLVILTLCLSYCCFAQVDQPQRVEFTFQGEVTGYVPLTCEKDGLLLWRKIAIPEKYDSLILELVKLNKDFGIEWQKSYLVSRQLENIDQKYFNGKAYFLFSSYTNRSKNLELITINLRGGDRVEQTIKNFIPFAYFDMAIMDEAIVVGGYFNYRPLAILFDLKEGVPKILPGLFNDRSQLVQMSVNANNTIDILLSGKNDDRVNTLFINTFDRNARLIKMIELEASKRKSLLFGNSQWLEDRQSQIVAGVYGRNNSDYSRGVFVANVNEYGEQRLMYYNYAELENFFNYMRAKREQRVKKRIERKRIKNKKIKFNYRLLVHDLIKYKDQYLLLGEAFYPKYKNVQGSSNMFNSRWSVNRGFYSYNRVFEGYMYTHAVILGFDSKGNLLWDNSFEIKDVLSLNLRQYVHAHLSKDHVNMLYVFDNTIRSKIIRGNEVLDAPEFIEIKQQYENDRVGENDTDIHGLEHWYDDVYITFGIQKIKNLKGESVMLNREVFFVNKIVPH